MARALSHLMFRKRGKERKRSGARIRRWILAILLVLLALIAVLVTQMRRPESEVLVVEQRFVETVKPKVCVHTLLENEVQEEKVIRSLEFVREVGASTIVQFFPWAYFETGEDQFDWWRSDRIVRNARLQGLRIIARLGLVAAWAREDGSGEVTTLNSLPEESFDDFAEAAAAFAARYAGEVDHLIIWNEPNLSFEWGYQPVDPGNYARRLRLTYPLVKAANPAAVVLAGALAPTLEGEGSAAGLDDLEYLQAMYEAGAGAYFDALAIHSYGFLDPPEAEPASDHLNFRRAELLREIMIENGDADKVAYITESGWNDHPRWTGAVRPSQRSAYTIRALEYVEGQWDWAETLCIWALRYPADVYSYPDNFTLVSADFVFKPIYFALQDYARGWEGSEALWLPPPLGN